MGKINRSNPEIDLTRFAYMISHRLEEMELSISEVTQTIGVSEQQISNAINGRAIHAGATLMLCHLLVIPFSTLLPLDTQIMFHKIQKKYFKHGVSPLYLSGLEAADE